jgi:hypothetical protein
MIKAPKKVRIEGMYLNVIEDINKGSIYANVVSAGKN